MSNPLLDELVESTVIPKIEIALPTRGMFYNEGEVLREGANPDELRVAPLSIIDESTFRDPLMLISGKAVSKMISRICPDIIAPGELCDIDIQAILIACRIASYGSKMKMEHACMKCGNGTVMELNLDEHMLQYTPYTEEDLKQFEVTVSELEHQIRLQPIRYADTVGITLETIRASREAQQFADSADDQDLTDDFLKIYSNTFEKAIQNNIDMITSAIVVVYTKAGNPVVDRMMIRDYVSVLPPQKLKEITDQIALVNKSIRERSMMDYQCEHCGETTPVQLELDPQKLFMPAEDSTQQKKSSAKSKPTAKKGKTQSRVSQR